MLSQLLFDESSSLLRYEFPPSEPSPAFLRNPIEIEKKFLAALRLGDRRRFAQYCHSFLPSGSDGTDMTFELFSLFSFLPYHYAFCEHSYTASLFCTSVFLAKEAADFHVLIAPSSLTYAPANESILRELFLLAGRPAADPSVSDLSTEKSDEIPPDLLPLLAKLPGIRRALLSPGHGRGFCDLRKLTEKTLGLLRDNPMFMHTHLCCTYSAAENTLWNLEFSSDLYVHILMSLLTALTTVSVNHRIELEMCPCRSWLDPSLPGADVRISTTLPNDPPALRRMNDSGTLRVIAVPGTVTELSLSIASVLASIAGLETSVLTALSSCRLEIRLSVFSTSEHPVPSFRYRDPYAAVEARVEEFMDFYASLSSADGLFEGRSE